MKKIRIQDLKPRLVPGLSVVLPGDKPYRESYFEWKAAPLTAIFKTRDIGGGTLKSWKSAPCFSEIETHTDAEMFHFLQGTAIMLFADMKNGEPDQKSLQIVRIHAGTQIIIPEGKGHFVPVAEDDTPLSVVVVAPVMEAPRRALQEPVLGV
jgi:mannose-6-phosphate isomerase-like protein (cupin superfamily)